ncbi:aldo-keto reductase family 1 member B1-like isoform X2 [Haliotis asinina]|uniref:aldo-keto reductase family 1 member B1-like isoform X2 n=1 Tax=Haliotis asinina TaxID=109174 RepID=UPI0035327028
MADRIPSMRLSSGYNMPMLGLGTNNCSKVSEVGNIVRTAIQIGYRYIDTTSVHETQQEIGVTIKQLINDGRIKREELFIVTKETERTKLTTTDFLDTWRAMEKLVDKGLVRSIGVSNFNKQQLERILKMDGLKYKPANNQVEITPSLCQEELLQFSLQNGISTTGCEPCGTLGQTNISKDSHSCQEPIVAIANKYGKSAAQVILRWGIQRGYAVVPGATNTFCLVQSMDIFNFELCKDDMQAIKALDKDTE